MSELKKERVLLLGCGNSRVQRVKVCVKPDELGDNFEDNFEEVWTIDHDPRCKPMIDWDLERFPWPVPKEHFDEIHAYEILEHLGQLGDYKFFFSLWRQIWDALVPGGIICATTPWWQSLWAWQDPGHRMIYGPDILGYLRQSKYDDEIGVTSMTDYRAYWPAPYNFVTRYAIMTSSKEPPDPTSAGFTMVLQKEPYVPSQNS